MRGIGLGVGDVGEVSGGAWGSGIPASCDDGRRAGGELKPRMVCRRGQAERDAAAEPCGDGVKLYHSARIELGACELHRAWSVGTHGMRGHGLGVGDVGEMPIRAWNRRNSAGVDDGRGEGWKRHAGMVGECGSHEHSPEREPGWVWVRVDDSTRGEHGAYELHGTSPGGAHGMRDDRVGVGDIGAVPGGAWGSRQPAGCDDIGVSELECKPDMVSRWRWPDECASSRKPCRHWVGVGHGAWVEHGAGITYWERSGGAHSMRVDRVGVGDISEVCGGAGSSGDRASGDDGRGARWERLASMVV